MPRRRKEPAAKELVGRLIGHMQGYGFVVPEGSGARGDVFIPAARMNGAADGDRVRVRLRASRHRARHEKKSSLEGEIVQVLEHSRTRIVGKVFRHGPDVYIVPLEERYPYTIRLAAGSSAEVSDGLIVAVRILAHPGRNSLPVGEMEEVLGSPDDPDIQYRIVCSRHGIPLRFSPASEEQARETTEPSAADHPGRLDLRDWPTLTIDGESARDFDDAVSIRRRDGGGYQLGVHIADVGHYVPLNTPLDAEALGRGTSVYFPDRAVPMLPEGLSNGICSLKPGVDRLTVSVLMELDAEGQVREVEISRSIIRSRARMTYTEVHAVLGGDSDLRARYRLLVEDLEAMLDLSRALVERRRRRGALDFDLPEPEVRHHPDGTIADIVRSDRNRAHRIIEEFMLLANETVARHLERKGYPLLYRVHEKPDEAKIEDFRETAARFGHVLEPDACGEYSSRSFQKLMSRLEDRPERRFLSYLMLRSFQQARYAAGKHRHFGLASDCYTHFTSPIRRYPDLVVHRLLVLSLESRPGDGELDGLAGRLPALAQHCSDREREAVAAEREIANWLMVRFMSEKLGEEFDALITGVGKGGFFVELVQHFVEGYVPVASLTDDSYRLHPHGYSLVGKRSGRAYRIGAEVRVRVDRAGTEGGRVEFSPVSPTPGGPGKRR